MVKPGDRVRFLNATGGGEVTRVEGKICYVEENGFETPVLVKEVVVVMPAGHQSDHPGAKLMFDQKAFDAGRKSQSTAIPKEVPAPSSSITTPKPAPAPKTDYGDKLSLALAFEPTNLKKLSDSKFNAVLVNDSNYTLYFTLSARGGDSREWRLVFAGELPANELIDLAILAPETLGDYERIALQGIAFSRDSGYELKTPFNIVRKLDLTKFYKLHCFRPGIYFDNPVLEIQLIDKDEVKDGAKVGLNLNSLVEKYEKTFAAAPRKEEKNKKAVANPAANPNKLLDLIEIDLHIGELTDSTAGMDPAAMLTLQIDTARKTMEAHKRRIGQKIVFIHGKGEGVLRKELLKMLRKEYPKAELQDASFREYGFGATLVTIH